MLDELDPILAGSVEPPSLPASTFFAVAMPAAAAAGPAMLPYLAGPESIRALDPSRVRRAVRFSTWMFRIIGGLDDVPEAISAIGGTETMLRQMMVNAPEVFDMPELLDGPDGRVTAYIHALTIETVDDWRDAVADVGRRVHELDLIRSALQPKGVAGTDKTQLASLYAGLAGYLSPLDLSAAELADRVRPLLASRIEADLSAIGAWPTPRGALAGLYVRVLLAAWSELVKAPSPFACATPGCSGTVPSTRNRRLCDRCRADHRRESVRRSRSRAASVSRSA